LELSALALLTDLYQLTMAYGYWKLKQSEKYAIFHLFFRKIPFNGGYAIAAGQALLREYLASFRFTSSDTEYLSTLKGNDGEPLFAPEFLSYLAQLRLTCDVDVMPEGTLAFPNEPIVRVIGPILQCQLLETALLNFVNFSTLIATKASRVCQAAQGDEVLEFGLRRAQGPDGGLTASRAAYIGGCAATSNVLAGKKFGIPVKGTHAHSWVMSYEDELHAFEQYASVLPNNCVFLVDTFNTLEGVRNACIVGKQLRERGFKLAGIRLDSGDLAYLSVEARTILDAAGFSETKIVASNDLDEQIIESLKLQGACISIWGVGTKLVTAYDQPALGGVYKLGAMLSANGTWEPRIKCSEQVIKTSIPGKLQVRRFSLPDRWKCDMIFDELQGIDPRYILVNPNDPLHTTPLASGVESEDLLVPLLRYGRLVGDSEPLPAIRKRVQEQLDKLHPTIRRRFNPHSYPVGLDIGLSDRRFQLIQNARRSI
jgi:nicotinate phosphoribosyltransferase